MAATRVQFNEGVLKRLMSDRKGPVAGKMLAMGYMVEAQAKANASGRMVNVRTGRLSGSIRTMLVQTPVGPVVFVGTNVYYAGFVHRGTRPHVIRPRNKQVLRFTVGGGRNGRGGKVVFARRVNHPGTQARPFLTQALRVLR